MADAGYNSEHYHRLACEELGIPLTVIKLNPHCAAGKMPPGHYRAQRYRHFPSRRYQQRAHAESVISRRKRILGSAWRARTNDSQDRKRRRRLLTHNLRTLVIWSPGQTKKCSKYPNGFNRAKR